MTTQDVPRSIREPGPGLCLFCSTPVERYRTAGNQYETGSPILSAFVKDPSGAWRLTLDGTMHRRSSHTKRGEQGYSVHLCSEEHR